MNRRSFLSGLSRGAGAASVATILAPASIARLEAETRRIADLTPEEVAKDETYWREIQQAFTVSRSLINLNNGGVCPSPRVVTESLVRNLWVQEEAPVYTMWKILEPRRETVRAGLAKLFGCDAEEIALVRNASEAMEILLMGLDLKSGDEVLTTTQDYGRMLTTLDQRRRREGIEVKLIKVPIPPENMDELAQAFERAITPRTKMLLMCHQVNITGQIFPVKRICEMAHRHGVEVMVDGAHSFTQFEFQQADIGCDYFGTSLHKWLLAPKGTGMLYVKRDKIGKIWPLMAAAEKMADDIRKFEEIGTHSAAQEVAVGDAIAFHHGIGGSRKEARLRYLKNYWAEKLRPLPNVGFHTSFKPEMSCAIATVEIEGVDPTALTDYLWDQHRIIVVAIKHDEFQGIRVTPNLYTTLEELDTFVEVMEGVARRGLPQA
jgi:selenocysteine lyase/cysteine desulfurase